MEYLLEMKGISKVFPGVKALDGVSISVAKGEVHGLVGENGAGKSTLMKILSGAYSLDSGEIWVKGEQIKHVTPKAMLECGISVIYQELALAPHLSIAENIFMGRLPRTRYGMVDWKKLNADAREVLAPLGLTHDPRTLVGKLNVGQRQMVEIAKALSRNARLIVLDEPSAVLGETELNRLFQVIRQLAEKGVSFIYISHRLSEIFQITQRVTVLKDGKLVGTDHTENLDTNRLVKMMVGRELSDVYPKRTYTRQEPALEVSSLSRKGVLHNISFTVHKGEIFGIAGLVGSGRTELLRAIVGADPIDEGAIRMFGRPIAAKSPKQAIKHGLGYLPEERKLNGLFLNQTGAFNISIAKFDNVASGWVISLRKEEKNARGLAQTLDVRPLNTKTKVKNFSGGNQQKFMFARWLNAESRILLVDEPTRGVDVGAKSEIYKLLAKLSEEGVTILMVSSELPEILGMSDRVAVMNGGRLTAILDRSEATEEKIMHYACLEEDSPAAG